MDAPNTSCFRIVLFGKTGAGKSSLANTILGEELFLINRSPDSETKCQVKTKTMNGKSITVIDNHGLFDPDRSEKDLKADIQRCVTECAPGPHVFLIVLKVEKFTEHEKAVITQICDHFSEDALKYAVVVFTHGDQLLEDMEIKEYVNQSEALSDLVKKCGGRCHVVDNKYWKKNQEDGYRSNHFQVSELLKTTEKIVEDNNGDYYSNEMLNDVERKIQKEEERIRQSSGNMTQEEIRKQARSHVLKTGIKNRTQTWAPYFVGGAVIALLAVASAVLIKSKFMKATKEDLTTPVITVLKDVIEVPPAAMIEEPQKTNAFQVIMDKLFALYERIYNP